MLGSNRGALNFSGVVSMGSEIKIFLSLHSVDKLIRFIDYSPRVAIRSTIFTACMHQNNEASKFCIFSSMYVYAVLLKTPSISIKVISFTINVFNMPPTRCCIALIVDLCALYSNCFARNSVYQKFTYINLFYKINGSSHFTM